MRLPTLHTHGCLMISSRVWDVVAQWCLLSEGLQVQYNTLPYLSLSYPVLPSLILLHLTYSGQKYNTRDCFFIGIIYFIMTRNCSNVNRNFSRLTKLLK